MRRIGSLRSFLISWQKQTEQDLNQSSLEFISQKPNWRLKFERSKTACLLLSENQEFFMPGLQASFEMKTQDQLHELIFLPLSSRKLVFKFPHLINVQEWYRNISVLGRDWKNLVNQFPTQMC